MFERFPQQRLCRTGCSPCPSYAVVFIGGFVDAYMGVMEEIYSEFQGVADDVPFIKGYYHWDGGAFGMLKDDCRMIARDIEKACGAYPGMPVAVLGHSYGGSAAIEVVRSACAGGVDPERFIVLTVDAVGRRQSRERAEGILFWGNSYLSEGGGLFDIVPRVGGRWGAVSGADANVAFSGYDVAPDGMLFSHRRPKPMIFGGRESLYGRAVELLTPRFRNQPHPI